MNNPTPIPFLDLASPHLQLEEQLVAVFREALRSGRFIGGPAVEAFERDFADFCQVKHSVGVGSGTDALRFALIAAGVGPGDIVITVPNTFIATTEAISQAGATPAFIDVDPWTYTMDPGKLREYLETQCARDDKTGRSIHYRTGKRVAAVIPVHLYGQTADMDSLLDLAEAHHLTLIEDACQAHGAEYYSKRDGAWRKAGSMGQAAAFSFYPGKNLGACGEAGAVTAHDDEIAMKIRMLRDHGQVKKYFHKIEGYNGRLDAIQAGILQVKLKHLSEWTESRRRHARRYNELFQGVQGITPPHEPSWAKAVYHLYVIRVPERDALSKHLADRHITTGFHYPIPLHLQEAYKEMGYGVGDFPVSESVSREILSLPMYPELSEQQQERIVSEIKKYLPESLLKKGGVPVS